MRGEAATRLSVPPRRAGAVKARARAWRARGVTELRPGRVDFCARKKIWRFRRQRRLGENRLFCDWTWHDKFSR